MSDALYEQDFYLWTQEQARALRAHAAQGANAPVDWENVAEEIESLGNARRSEVRSRLRILIEHLLKLEFSPARDPRLNWRRTVTIQRAEIEDVLDENPSLRRELPDLVERVASSAVRLASDALAEYGETAAAAQAKLAGVHYTLDQLLKDWFPAEPE